MSDTIRLDLSVMSSLLQCSARIVAVQNNDEDREPADETRLSDEEATELVGTINDLMGLMVSVKVESEAPAAGAAVQLAERIRAELQQPECRIQDGNDGADAVLGPISGDADHPGPALTAAMTALGGNWGDITVTTNNAGPVHYVIRAAEQSPDKAGPPRIHLWAGSAFALVRYAEEHS